MTRLITAPLSSKAQLTLPKRVRELLRVHAKGDRVGFLIDEKTRRVTMTKVELIPADEPYTEAEIRKLMKLRKEPGGRTFNSMEELLRDLKSK